MLKNEAKVNVEYIWDDLTIDGKEVKDWLEYRQAEQPEWDAQKEFSEELKPQIGEMIATANKKLEDKNLYRSEEHTSELQSRQYLVCRLLLEKKKKSSQTVY